jgi:hypothetical protein
MPILTAAAAAAGHKTAVMSMAATAIKVLSPFLSLLI